MQLEVDPAPARPGRAGHGITGDRARRRPPGDPGPILLNRRAATRPTITGVERYAGEVIRRLVALGPDRYVVCQPPPRARRRAAAQAWEQTALPARAARLRASLIFSPANLAPLAWPRNVLVVHDAAVVREPGAYSRAYRAWHGTVGLTCARRAVAVVTVSEFSRRELVSLAGLRPDLVHVIPGGVDGRFAARGGEAVVEAAVEAVRGRLGLRRPYVLTVATEDARKNLGALAPVAAALDERGIELVRAGDTRPYFARGDDGRPRSAPTRASDAVRSLGYVDDADLPALYRGALAFVLPSRYEGFGLTCIEAMAAGTPVVAADRAALPETCGDAALLVDPDDGRAMTAAVLAAATDAEERARLRMAGAERARRFTWDRTAASVHALLAELSR